LTQSVTGQTLRTVYDGRSFEVIREGETFRDGSLTTRYSNGGTTANTEVMQSNRPAGERYRWVSEGGVTGSEDGYMLEDGRYGGRGVTLYGNGEAVAVSYSSSSGSRSVYLGKDMLGSVKTATADGGTIEDRYEYDAFGQPYSGDLSGMMNLGYTGKPYDAATGLYNYGYRDYSPVAARFTTVDPIRDRNNWFAYVNNDPVNWIDPWGLSASDPKSNNIGETNTAASQLPYLKDVQPSTGNTTQTTTNSVQQNGNASTRIYTIGVSASVTLGANSYSVGFGIYINPMNLSEIGTYTNYSAGLGAGLSGSVATEVGTYTSLEAARGVYYEAGVSVNLPSPVKIASPTVGVDIVTDKNFNLIGGTVSYGISLGTSFEGHARVGSTTFTPFRKQ
jgi:RHS repeat-associated protein